MKEIERLSDQGLTSSEIAERLKLARSTVNKYRRDPDGSHQRALRDGHRGQCHGCGRMTSGQGPGRASDWCPEYAPTQRRRWSDAEMLEAIRAWEQRTGRRVGGGVPSCG